MKDLFKSGVIVLIIIGVLYLIFLRECKKTDCPPKGYILVWGSTWDSVNKMMNRPPEIIIKKEYIKGDTVFIPADPLPVPTPDPVDTTIKGFHNSIKNDKIDAWVDFALRGELLYFRWGYVPITTTVTLEKLKYVPQIVDRPVPVPKNGLYLSGQAGGNKDAFLFGSSLDLITKKESIYGLQYQRMGGQNFYSFRLGAKIVL